MHWGYLLATLVLLAVEVLIALLVDDQLVRPYVGDALAVVLVYVGLRGFTRISMPVGAIAALAVAFAIEFGQYFHILYYVGLGHSRLARIVLGSMFEVRDLFAYVVGIVGALVVETMRTKRHLKSVTSSRTQPKVDA